MAVTLVNSGINKTNKKKNIKKPAQVINHLVDNCCVVVERFDECMLKKRGRPKKLIDDKNKSSVLLNKCDDNSVVSNSSGINPEDSSLPIIVKKRRGRPKKSEVASNIQQPQIISNKLTHKKKRKRNVKKRTAKRNILKDNKNVISNDEDIDFVNNELTKKDLICTHPKSDTLQNCDEYVKISNKGTTEIQDTLFNFNEVNWNITFPKRVKSKSITTLYKCNNSHVKQNDVANIEKVNMSLDLNKVNWHKLPKQERSKSVEELIKTKTSKKIDEFENLKLKKYSKSISYLDPGPNIHIKRRYDKYGLLNIYKSKLKRVRSYPNCSLMDSTTLNFLVNNMEYYYGAYTNKYYNDELSDKELLLNEELLVEDLDEIHLVNNISKGGLNRKYRSKSMPLEHFGYKVEKNVLIYRSIDNLHKLVDTNELLPITFHIPSDKCDLKDIEHNSEECNNKIRRSKRLNGKIKHIDILEEEYLLKSDGSKFDYLTLAQQIRKENAGQLLKARKNDPELEEKLRKLNFTLITNNIFRPNK